MSVPSKIFARAIINRLHDEVNNKNYDNNKQVSEERNTTEQIFIIRNIIEQSIE